MGKSATLAKTIAATICDFSALCQLLSRFGKFLGGVDTYKIRSIACSHQEHVDRRGKSQTHLNHGLFLPHEILASMYTSGNLHRLAPQGDTWIQ